MLAQAPPLDAAGNDDPRGIWSNGETMWVADADADAEKLFAYARSSRRAGFRPAGALAPALLQEAVLEPIFGIDARALAGGDAVSYTHDPQEALDAVQRGSAAAAFILPAPTLQDVIDTADGGGFMPQKSTYSVPKLPTGVVLHAFD